MPGLLENKLDILPDKILASVLQAKQKLNRPFHLALIFSLGPKRGASTRFGPEPFDDNHLATKPLN